jgi:DNA-binding PadR family transcriptional regulator
MYGLLFNFHQDDQRVIMSIRYAILGFLSWTSLTGYELKKLFDQSTVFPWSGNNNQIYRTLIELHQEALVTLEVQHQETHPSRKIYTITDKGRSELRDWVLSSPEPPQLRNSFLIQLAWADQLRPDELDALLEKYEEEVSMQLTMTREQQQRHTHSPQRTPREAYLWQMISENQISYYESDLSWVRKLRRELNDMQESKHD